MAIDRANAEHFMLQCLNFFPFGITHVLTDNGLEFTNKLIKNKKGAFCTKPSKLDLVCKKKGIEHRLTKPGTPKTNGIVKKANDIIKQKTGKITDYQNLQEMNNDLMKFLMFCNLYRRHGSLRKELKVKTPFNAVKKWHELDPDIFKETLASFKNKILNLQTEKQVVVQQPCET